VYSFFNGDGLVIFFDLGFNGGSTLAVMDGWWKVAGVVCINTALSSSTGAIGGMLYSMWDGRSYGVHVNIIDTANGILAGLVGITASASVVSYWAAILIGFITSWACLAAGRFIEKHQLFDDPIGAFVIHGFGGILGCLYVGLFAHPEPSSGKVNVTGLFYGNAELLGKQIVGILAVAAWSFTLAYSLCFLVNKFLVTLRVPPEIEKIGLDITEHRIGYRRNGKAGMEGFMASKDALNAKDMTKSQIINTIDEASNVGYAKIDLPENFRP
jgi:Amt family ammonium transporter